MAKEIATKTKLDTRIVAEKLPQANVPSQAPATTLTAGQAVQLLNKKIVLDADVSAAEQGTEDVVVAQAAGAASSGAAAGGAAAGVSTTALVVAGVAVAAAASNSNSSSPAVASSTTTPSTTTPSTTTPSGSTTTPSTTTPSTTTPSATTPTTTPTVAPASYALKTGAEKYDGTTGNDIVSGAVSTTGSAATLDGTDTLDGSTGTDTLRIEMQGDFAGVTTGSIKGFETLEINNTSLVGRTFNATGVKDVTAYVIDSAKAATGVTVQGVGNLADVTIKNQAGGATTLQFAAGALSTTADNAMKVGLDSVTGTSAFTANNIQAMTLSSKGANAINLDGSSELTSITATGDSTLGLRARVSGLQTVDASGVTGAVTGDFRTATSLKSVKTGAGDDTITVTSLGPVTVVDGGAGKNTLVMDDFGPGSFRPNVSNIQTLRVTDSTGTLNLNMDQAKGVETLTYDNLGGGITLQSLGANAITISSQGAQAAAQTIQALGTGATTFKSTAAAASTAGTNDTVVTSLTTSGSSLNIDVAARTNMTGTFTANSATSVELNANGGFTGNIVAGSARSLKVNAGENAAVNFAGGTFTLLDTISATSKSNVTFGALAALNTATFSGQGSSTQTLTTGNIGLPAATGAINLTASGFQGGITIGTVDSTEATKLNFSGATGSVTTGALGTATTGGSMSFVGTKLGTNIVGAVNAGRAKDISIDASGSLGNVTVGAVSTTDGLANAVTGALAMRSGTATIDVTNTSGDVTIGAVTAGTVTFKASGVTGGVNGAAAGAVTGSTINAVTANIVGSTTGANTFANVTANNVTYTGGLGVDTLNITGQRTNSTANFNETASLNISTGAGNDVVTFTAAANTQVETITGTVNLGAGAGNTLTLNAAATNTTFNASGLTVQGLNPTVIANGGAALAANVLATNTDWGLVAIVGAGAAGQNIAGVAAAANHITGTAGADTIVGGNLSDTIVGGGGNDNLQGGSGGDFFVIGQATFAGTIDGGGGTDQIRLTATTDFTGATLTSIEAVRIASAANADTAGIVAMTFDGAQLNGQSIAFTEVNAAAGNDTILVNGTANADTINLGGITFTSGTTTTAGLSVVAAGGNDTITGTAGSDTITGGAGSDTISTGNGNDVVIFDSPATTDTITDYVVANDSIQLSKAAMAGLGLVGALTAPEFESGAGLTAAASVTGRIVYNTTTGALYYDADGSGATAAVQIATFTSAPVLVVGEFAIIA